MFLASDVVERRARLLARVKLAFDLLLVAGLYFGEAPWAFLIIPVLDILLLWPCLRYIKRAPALLTLAMLALSAIAMALAPMALGNIGVAAWVLYPLLPLAVAYVLGRRGLVWQTAMLTAVIAGIGAYLLLRAGQSLVLDQTTLLALGIALAITIGMASWLAARSLRASTSSRDLLGEPLIVVRNVMIAPFAWVVGGVPSEALQLELHELKRRYNPRWIVLDMAPAGELGRRDLNAIDQAAAAVTTSHCTVVLARPPVDALGHLDFAQPLIGRVERFATVPQAVEAGLRRLGWTQHVEQPERLITHL